MSAARNEMAKSAGLALAACLYAACGSSAASVEQPSKADPAGTSAAPASASGGGGTAAPPRGAAGATAAVGGGRAGASAAAVGGNNAAAGSGNGAAGAAAGSNNAAAGAAAGSSSSAAGSSNGAAGSSNDAAGAAAGSGGGARDDSDAGVMDTAAAPRSTGPGDWVAGDYPPDLMQQNYLEITGLSNQPGPRQYKVHVPPGYDPKVPAPLLFCFHGLGQDAVMFCVTGANMPAKSDEAGFVLVMPNGYANSWNAGTCCGDAADMKLDDVGFVRAVFQEVSKHVNVDLSRVYATGLSNGGYISYRLACEASDLFVAVAPGAGAIGSTDVGGGTSTTSDITTCDASKISVLDIHGTEDPLIPYSTQKPSLERIATQDGCMLTTQPASQPASQGDTTCVSYQGCAAGVDVTGCSVMGGGHVWFGSPNCGTGVDAACAIVGQNSQDIVNTDVIWEFFKAHARP